MRGSRGPSPARNSCGNVSLQAANWSSVLLRPSASPTSVATSPTTARPRARRPSPDPSSRARPPGSHAVQEHSRLGLATTSGALRRRSRSRASRLWCRACGSGGTVADALALPHGANAHHTRAHCNRRPAGRQPGAGSRRRTNRSQGGSCPARTPCPEAPPRCSPRAGAAAGAPGVPRGLEALELRLAEPSRRSPSEMGVTAFELRRVEQIRDRLDLVPTHARAAHPVSISRWNAPPRAPARRSTCGCRPGHRAPASTACSW